MKKRFLVIILIGLALLLIPLFANAAIVDSGDCGSSMTWTLDDKGVLTISGDGYMTSSPWTEKYRGYALGNNPGIKKVIIEYGVTNIINKAFNQCYELVSITIPNTVTKIESSAFTSCKSLTNITIPNSVTIIDEFAFHNCYSLKIISIPDSVTSIGTGAFYNCTSLSSVTLPNSINCIYNATFYGCSSLTSIIIPDSITTIELQAFKGCTSLTNVNLPSSLLEISEETFDNCQKLTNINIPKEVKLIKNYAFRNCYSLKKVTIQGLLNRPPFPAIGDDAFKNCYDLSSIELSQCNIDAIQWFEDNGYENALNITPHPLEKHDKFESTYSSAGTEEYWECTVCGKLFSDSEGENEIHSPVQIPKLDDIDISKAKISTIQNQVYTGRAIKPDFSVTYDGEFLTENEDYTVKWSNNKNPGKATLTISGIGYCQGSKTTTFKILPKPVELSSLKAGKKSLTVKWKKGSKIDGYEIQYSLKSNFKSAKKITISKASTKKTEIDGLKKKKTYYVRIRTYKEVDGKKYYSEWSDAMEQKTK